MILLYLYVAMGIRPPFYDFGNIFSKWARLNSSPFVYLIILSRMLIGIYKRLYITKIKERGRLHEK
ncbi:hypothetical protein CLOHAE12215_01362 [Clostridium haemolyticum]|nr:hypothetical protein CLOHAE12215_01362 [Clostridium haemolyticum]